MGTTADTEWVHDGERRDRLGRRQVPAERRRALLAAFRESGQTRRAFARQERIRYTTLCSWVQQAQKAAGHPARPEPVVRFAEVALPPSAARGMEVRLADGTVVRGERLEDVVSAVKALRG
jgi:transposase-like protein